MDRRANARWLVAALVLAPSTALAQQAGDTPAPPAGTADAASAAQDPEGEIIVTAQRRAERLRDVPISLITNNADQLEAAGVSSTKDLQLVVPGLTFSTMGAWANVAVRGVSTSLTAPGAEAPIAVYVDGVYQPSQLGVISDLPDIQRVEVSKGPQGTLFGRNATGGAISIYTRDPSFTTGGTLTLEDGMFAGGNDTPTANAFRIDGFVTGGLSDSLAASASLSYSNVAGYVRNDVTGGSFGAAHSFIGRAKLMYRPSDTLTLVASGYYMKRYDEAGQAGIAYRGYTIDNGATGAIFGQQPWHFAYDGPKPHTSVKGYGGNLKAVFDFDVGTLTSITAGQRTAADIHVDVDGGYLPACMAAGACASALVVQSSTMYSQELDFASRKFGGFSFLAGLYAYHEDGEIDNIFNGFQYTHQIVKTTSFAVFGEVNYDLSSRLHLIGGVRYSTDKKTLAGNFFGLPDVPANPGEKSWSSVTPRASIRYDITDRINAYFTYSQGFKSGAFSASSFSDPPINPETLRSYEIGTKMAFGGIALNAAAFWYDYTDLQIQTFNGTSTISANADARIFGVDVDGSVRLGPNFTLRGGFSYLPTARYIGYQVAQDFLPPLYPFGTVPPPGFGNGLQSVALSGSGKRITKSPEFTGSATLSYEQDIGSGNLGANLSLYHSSSYSWHVAQLFNTGEYTTLAADISYQPANFPVKFTIWGKNLTNAAYVTGTLISTQAYMGYFAPPRQIGVRAKLSF